LRASAIGLAWGAVVYHISRQRNDFKYGNQGRWEEKMLQDIAWAVRHKIFGKGKFKSDENAAICNNWGIYQNVLL
jgi:hypothetical protein